MPKQTPKQILSEQLMTRETKTFVCDDCGEEFPIADEADNGVCDWCWLVSGA